MRRVLVCVSVALAVFLSTATSALALGGGVSAGGGARGGGFSGGGSSSAGRSSSSSSSSSSSAKSGGSSSGVKAGGSSSGSGGVRPSSIRQPSSGRIQQPAPAPRLVPRTLPPGARVPRGRNFVRDTATLRRNPRYLDPYDNAYYGNPASPYFYLWLAAMQNNGPHPVAYQAPQCKSHNRGVATWVFVVGLIVALVIGGICGAVLSSSDF